MREKKTSAVFLVVVTLSILLWSPSSSLAQDYSFSLDREVVDVWVNRDGSVSLEYWFTFTCDQGNYHIDAVDVGLPNGDFRRSDIRGDVDGRSIDRIGSDYQGSGDHGVAVWLGGGQGSVKAGSYPAQTSSTAGARRPPCFVVS